MGGNSDSDEFEDDGAEEIGAETDIDLDLVIRDMDIAAEIIGIRGAACAGGARTDRICEESVRGFQTAMNATGFTHCMR